MDRRPCPGIKYLRKDFLQYELAIRRLPTEGAVPELIDRLRAGLESPVVVSPEIIGDVAAAAQNMSKTLYELERNVSFFEVSHPTSTQTARVWAYLIHLKTRLCDLKRLELDNALSQSVDRLIDYANILHNRAFQIRELSLRLDRERERAGSDGLGTRPGIGELAVSQSVDRLIDNDDLLQVRADSLGIGREEQSAGSNGLGTRPGSGEPDGLSQSADHLKDGNLLHFMADPWGIEIEQQSARSDGRGTRPWSSDVCASVSHSSSPQLSYFARLPDSISCLLNGITELSASSVNCIQQLLWLLARLEQFAIELQIPHNVVLSLLLPLAVGDLRSLLSEALKEGFSIEQFRQIVIARKLSPCMRNELEQSFFWRVQGPQETLSEYVKRVSAVVLALVMNISEGEIISHVLQGMRPDYQSRLTLFDRPSTLEELQWVVESIEALTIADRQRQEAEGAPFSALN